MQVVVAARLFDAERVNLQKKYDYPGITATSSDERPGEHCAARTSALLIWKHTGQRKRSLPRTMQTRILEPTKVTVLTVSCGSRVNAGRNNLRCAFRWPHFQLDRGVRAADHRRESDDAGEAECRHAGQALADAATQCGDAAKALPGAFELRCRAL